MDGWWVYENNHRWRFSSSIWYKYFFTLKNKIRKEFILSYYISSRRWKILKYRKISFLVLGQFQMKNNSLFEYLIFFNRGLDKAYKTILNSAISWSNTKLFAFENSRIVESELPLTILCFDIFFYCFHKHRHRRRPRHFRI